MFSKETVQVYLFNASATKGDVLGFLVHPGIANDNSRTGRGHFRNFISLASQKGRERIYGVCLKDGVAGDWINVQVTGVALVNCVGQNTDQTTGNAIGQAEALCIQTAGNQTNSSPLYSAVSGDRVIAQAVAYGNSVISGPGSGLTGTVPAVINGFNEKIKI